MKTPLYLDYNATTPVDPRVMEAMLPYFTERFGNPASRGHAYGWAADEAVALAREQTADILGAEPDEIVFTSGATESIHAALKGCAEAYSGRGSHLITTRTEHSALLGACADLERRGFRLTYLDVGPDGRVAPESVEQALEPDTILVAVMWANNETGIVQPIEEVASITRPRGIFLFTDATQAVGKLPVSTKDVDLLACSGHKVYGPKGVGALYVRRRGKPVRPSPLFSGGGQQEGMRAGTLNVPGIVGLGAALAIAASEGPEDARRLEALRDRLEQALEGYVPGMRVHGQGGPRLPQTTCVTLPGYRAANVMTALRDLAFSAGSACSSGTGRPSHVLKAMGLTDAEALGTIRLSLGRFTTPEEIDHAVGRFADVLKPG